LSEPARAPSRRSRDGGAVGPHHRGGTRRGHADVARLTLGVSSSPGPSRADSSRLLSSQTVSICVASWPNPMGAGSTRLHVPEATWRGWRLRATLNDGIQTTPVADSCQSVVNIRGQQHPRSILESASSAPASPEPTSPRGGAAHPAQLLRAEGHRTCRGEAASRRCPPRRGQSVGHARSSP
jgi:hypothetical protein